MKIILKSADFSNIIPEFNTEFTYGKVYNGKIISDTSKTRAVSDFIDVRNGNYIVGLFKDSLYSAIDFIFYDENKLKISVAANPNIYFNTNNVSYVRFSARRTDGATFELEDIASSFFYRLTNVYSKMFIYGTLTSGTGALTYTVNRLVSNNITVSGTKVMVNISNPSFSVAELDGFDSNENIVGKVTQNTTISTSITYIRVIVRNTNNANILPDTLKDSEVTITWT